MISPAANAGPAAPGHSWTEGHLNLEYRGVKMRLEPGDPRLPFIELLLFGKTLPPPVPAPAEPTATRPEPPRVEVPAPWVRFWKTLPETHRRVLATLSRESLTSPVLEQRMKLGKEGLRAVNILIALRARDAGLETPIDAVGRGRPSRRYFLGEQAIGYVLELDRRWEKVREALAEAEGD